MRINKFFATTVSLFLLLLVGGFASYLVVGANEKGKQLLSEFKVAVYVADSVSDEQICALEKRFTEDKQVEEVEFISKRAAADEFATQFGISVGEKNPLPASFRIRLKKNIDVKKFEVQVADFKGVDEIDYPYSIAQDVKNNLRTMGYFAGGFCFVLAIVILIVFRNVIRMDVAASAEMVREATMRRMPINYIRQPFIVRAFTQGAMAGGLASVFLFLTTTGIATLYPFTKLPIDLSVMFVIFAVMILTGILLSWLFAYMAVGCQIKNR